MLVIIFSKVTKIRNYIYYDLYSFNYYTYVEILFA